MTDEPFEFELDLTARLKPVPCPNCKNKLERKIVMSESSANCGRPYVMCSQCSTKGEICFWFLDLGECELCGWPQRIVTSSTLMRRTS
jgi:hypothetical protein